MGKTLRQREWEASVNNWAIDENCVDGWDIIASYQSFDRYIDFVELHSAEEVIDKLIERPSEGYWSINQWNGEQWLEARLERIGLYCRLVWDKITPNTTNIT